MAEAMSTRHPTTTSAAASGPSAWHRRVIEPNQLSNNAKQRPSVPRLAAHVWGCDGLAHGRRQATVIGRALWQRWLIRETDRWRTEGRVRSW
jgi:hypothetical protein